MSDRAKPGAAHEMEALRDAVLLDRAAVLTALRLYRDADTNVVAGSTLEVRYMQAAVLIQACEVAADALAQQAKTVRAALAGSMAESGCPGVRMPTGQLVHTRETARPVVIPDREAVPRAFCRYVPATEAHYEPDTTLIRKALNNKTNVNWATLGPAGKPSLVIEKAS